MAGRLGHGLLHPSLASAECLSAAIPLYLGKLALVVPSLAESSTADKGGERSSREGVPRVVVGDDGGSR